jgi:hypothetical protein
MFYRVEHPFIHGLAVNQILAREQKKENAAPLYWQMGDLYALKTCSVKLVHKSHDYTAAVESSMLQH